MPGLSSSRLDSVLEAETRRVDPTLDNWSSEAISEQAQLRLKKLTTWLVTGSSFPKNIFEPNVAVSTLRPTELSQTKLGPELLVYRWQQTESTESSFASRLPETRVSELEEWLVRALPVRECSLAEAKIIHVELANDLVMTKVRCHFSGADQFRYQQNATWEVSWKLRPSQPPSIQAIELTAFEEIHSTGEAQFSDMTAAVFQDQDCFEQQLVRSIDYWRDRLDWRLGWQAIGSHGIAVGDVNGDGLDDLYLCETGGLPNRLLLQQQNGTLQDISKESGVDVLEPTRAALLLDLDNDGDQDLIIGVARFMIVFENTGAARFKQHPTLQGAAMIHSMTAVDFDQDGLLDVYVCGYNLRSGDAIGLGQPIPYHDANNGAPNSLLKNLGGFRFNNVTEQVGLNENNRRFSYAAAWEDFDNDGDQDLYVANDYGRNNLYRNDDGNFHDIAAKAGVEDIAAGMSVSWGDYNRDGLPDIYVANMFSSAGNRIAYQRQFRSSPGDATKEIYQRHARGNSLFQNMGDGTFRDVSESAAVTEGRWAWGANFVDINNDGWQDLVVANGMMTGTDDTKDL